LEEHIPPNTDYSDSACRRSLGASPMDTNVKNYACVMWDLHLMTVTGMVDYNTQSYDATEMLHPATTLHTIYEYVKVFGSKVTKEQGDRATDRSFGVNEEAMKFVRLYDDCALDRCTILPDAPKFIYQNSQEQISKEVIARITTSTPDWIAASVYLGKVRNAIAAQQQPNDGTGNSRNEWPSREACPSCWTRSGGAEKRNDWNLHEGNLYKYLKVEFGHWDETSRRYRHELHEEKVTNMDRNDDSSGTSSSYIRGGSMTVSIRQASLIAVFVLIAFIRWIAGIQRQRKAMAILSPEQMFFDRSKTYQNNACIRSIKNSFEEATDHLEQSNFIKSPTRKTLMKNRLTGGSKPSQRSGKDFPTQDCIERLEDPSFDGDHRKQTALPPIPQLQQEENQIGMPNTSTTTPSSSPFSMSNSPLRASLSNQLRRRLPALPITNA
jgi:hypothetical protein